MEIKNFLGNFPGSSGKIKIAIFGVFVLAGAVFFAFAGFGRSHIANAGLPCYEDETILETRSCGVNGETENLTGNVYRCGRATTGAPRWFEQKWEKCAAGQKCCVINGNAVCVNIDQNCGGTALVCAPGATRCMLDGLLQTCKSDGTWDNGQPSGSCDNSVVAEGGCNGSNEGAACGDDNNKYCLAGVCVLGCKSVSGKIVPSGGKTCEKPSYLSLDGVYKCVNTPGSISGLRKGDGTKLDPVSESNPSYHLELQEACYSGCSGGACANGASCENLASSIMDALKTYVDGVNSITGTGACAGILEIKKQSDADTCYNDLKTKTKNKILTLSDKSGVISVFEKLAFSGETKKANGYTLFTAPSGYGKKITSLTKEDILCAPKSDIGNYKGERIFAANNEPADFGITGLEDFRCLGENAKTDKFKGYSFECKKVNGCGIYSWLLNQNAQKCTIKDVDPFKDNGYFRDCDKDGIYDRGWSAKEGADASGCGYYSIASIYPGGGNNKDPQENSYSESKIETGKCYSKSSVTVNASALSQSCSAYVGGGAETEDEPEEKRKPISLARLTHIAKARSGFFIIVFIKD